MRVLGFLFVCAGAACLAEAPQPCRAEVQLVAKTLDGSTFYTTWWITHNGGAEALREVYFSYRIKYRSRRGTVLTEEGNFLKRVYGQGERRVLERTSTYDPEAILGVELLEVKCHR